MKLISFLKIKTTKRLQKIPPKLVKISPEELSQPLADAINSSISKGVFPENAKLHLFPLLTNNRIIKIKSQILDHLMF